MPAFFFLPSISNILRRILSELKNEQTRKTIQLYIMHINTICPISKLLLLLLLLLLLSETLQMELELVEL
jgi:hypothetical protein